MQSWEELILDVNSANRWSSTESNSYVNTHMALYQSHYPRPVEHLGERFMYNNMRRQYFWPHMANDIYLTIRDFSECIWDKPSEKSRHPLQLSQANCPLAPVAMDILKPLLGTLNGIQFVLMMPDRHLKLLRAIRTSKSTAAHMMLMFMDHWNIHNGMLTMCWWTTQRNVLVSFSVALCPFRNITPNVNGI